MMSTSTHHSPTRQHGFTPMLAALILAVSVGIGCNDNPGGQDTPDAESGDDAVDAADAADSTNGSDADGGVDPRLLDPTKLSAVYGHTCMIRSDQTVNCWGLGSQPDVYEGEGDHDQADPPDGKFVDISAGRFHTCGIRPDLSLECWGVGSEAGENELPDGYDYDQSLVGSGKYIEVSAGAVATCAIRVDRLVVGWGFHDETALGFAEFKAISAGWDRQTRSAATAQTAASQRIMRAEIGSNVARCARLSMVKELTASSGRLEA